MANSKKKNKTTRRRGGRRMSGAATDGLMTVVAGVAGYVGGKMLAGSVLPNMDEKTKGVVLAALGHIGLPMLSKSPMIKAAGFGITIAGADMALRGFGVINGRGYPMLPAPMVAGIGDGTYTVAGNGGIPQTTVAGSRRRRYDGA